MLEQVTVSGLPPAGPHSSAEKAGGAAPRKPAPKATGNTYNPGAANTRRVASFIASEKGVRDELHFGRSSTKDDSRKNADLHALAVVIWFFHTRSPFGNKTHANHQPG